MDIIGFGMLAYFVMQTLPLAINFAYVLINSEEVHCI